MHDADANARTRGSLPQGEEPIVRAAAAGDRGAWTELYTRYAAMIHALLLLSMRREEAEDLTQEVFLKAMSRLKELREPGAVGPWLCALARNAGTDWIRKNARMKLHVSSMPVEEPRLAGGAAVAGGEQVLEHLRRLPEAFSQTLALRLVCGLTGPQIAAATGMTEGSVRVNLCRGMAMLRESLGFEKGVTRD